MSYVCLASGKRKDLIFVSVFFLSFIPFLFFFFGSCLRWPTLNHTTTDNHSIHFESLSFQPIHIFTYSPDHPSICPPVHLLMCSSTHLLICSSAHHTVMNASALELRTGYCSRILGHESLSQVLRTSDIHCMIRLFWVGSVKPAPLSVRSVRPTPLSVGLHTGPPRIPRAVGGQPGV